MTKCEICSTPIAVEILCDDCHDGGLSRLRANRIEPIRFESFSELYPRERFGNGIGEIPGSAVVSALALICDPFEERRAAGAIVVAFALGIAILAAVGGATFADSIPIAWIVGD